MTDSRTGRMVVHGRKSDFDGPRSTLMGDVDLVGNKMWMKVASKSRFWTPLIPPT